MTEAEAQKKICPILTGKTGNRDHTHPCLGSGCMAWRWTYQSVADEAMLRSSLPFKPKTKIVKTEHGYCGLAGKL